MPRLGLGLGLNRGGFITSAPFDPLSLNPLLYYDAESSMLADGGGAAAQGDSIATLDDLSANSIDATQPTALYQPIAYDADNGGPFARFDGNNDRMSFTLADPIENGTVFFATKKGSYAANINLAAGTHSFSGNKISNIYAFANDLVALLLFDFALSQSEIDQLTSYFVAKGAVEDFGAEINLDLAWLNATGFTVFPAIDTSSCLSLANTWQGQFNLLVFPFIVTDNVQNFNATWRFCTLQESFPSLNLNAGSRFTFAWGNNTNLKHFPAGMFDNWNPSVIFNGVFNNTWDDCSLTPQSVENILVSIDTSGKWATTNGTIGGSSLSDPVIDIDYDGSGLTAATIAAIASLQSKGWGININP